MVVVSNGVVEVTQIGPKPGRLWRARMRRVIRPGRALAKRAQGWCSKTMTIARSSAQARRASERLASAAMHATEYLAQHDRRLASPMASLLGRSHTRFRGLRRVTMCWLDEDVRHRRMCLEPTQPSISFGPTIGGMCRQQPVILPNVHLYQFDDAVVSASSSSILCDGRLIVERVDGVDSHRCDFSADHLVMHGQGSAYVARRPVERMGPGLFLAGNGQFNYYHWMIEILPKAQFLDVLDEIHGSRIPILISDVVANTDSMSDALHRLVGDRPAVVMSADKSYRVDKLFYINAPSTCPFNLRRGEELRISDVRTRGSSVQFLQGRLLTGSDAGSGRGAKRVFFARRPGRRNYNQDEVFAVFEPHGFVSVYMEELSLTQQIDVVSNANLIAGPTGAAWTNLIFCRPGAMGLCWMAEESGDFAGYSNLANVVGAELRYVTYRTGAKSTSELYSRAYRVDANRLRVELEAMLGSAD
jgi:capsular polysaccharide biosynthesis protein